jgi:hypothetical protein
MAECGCETPPEAKPTIPSSPGDKWKFYILEDGREKGYNFLIMRAVHPAYGSIIRMWGWYPSEDEINKFKRNTIEVNKF